MQSLGLVMHSERSVMSNALITYLHDHLAGARFALNLLESLRNGDQPVAIRKLADGLLYEITEDRRVLEELADRIGKPVNTLKEGAAWLAQKASLWKLGRDDSALSTFEAVETLSLGILGKLALWRALRVLQPSEPLLYEINLEQLCRRAEDQFFRVERLRIKLAPRALSENRAIAEVA
jgi:hypothetical protein